MTRKLHSAVMVLVVLVSAVVGGVALGGTAAALDGSAAGTYPSTPGTDTLGTFVYVVRPNDNVAENGIKTITLNASSGASFENVTDEDVFVSVRGGQRIEIAEEPSDITEVNSLNVSTSANGSQLTITLPRPVRPRTGGTGAEVAIKIENFTTPSQSGSYTVEGTFADPSGSTDGPASVSYSVSSPALSMSNQSVSQFNSTQTLDVSASIPGGGYVGIFTTSANGSPDRLIGWTNVSSSSATQNYTVDVGQNISESQQLVAVAYAESEGRSAGLRAQQSFDPQQDERLTVNGTLVNATGFVSTLDVDSRVTAGSEYSQGAQLYFSGEPNTAYQIRTVQNGTLGSAATQFQTVANGTAVIDTAQLDEGRYAITRVADNSLVSLDNDSTTGPGDDSFFVTGQQATTTGATTTVGGTTDGGTAATESPAPTAGGAQTEAAGGAQTATAAGTAGGAGSGTGTSGGGGGGQQGTDAGGPGFGVVVALVALLGATLLATRRR